MGSYTVKQVADMLKVDPETVRRWVREHKIIAVKLSNKSGNRISDSALRSFLKNTPKYAKNAPAIIVATGSAVALAAYAAGKVVESNSLKKASFDGDAVINFIRSEISSHKALIASKKKSIRQIEKEIEVEQARVDELTATIDSIRASVEKSPDQLHVICDQCGAIMDHQEGPDKAKNTYVCPKCGWTADEAQQ